MWPVEFSLAHRHSRGLFTIQSFGVFCEKLTILYHLASNIAPGNLQNQGIFKVQWNLLFHWNLLFQVSNTVLFLETPEFF